MKRILMTLTALTLVGTMMFAAFAEEPAATTPNTAADSAATMADAQTAYAAAKQSTSLTDYEAELNSMVAAGTLTQAQADLLLTAAKESVALRSGTCPECGYQFQTNTGSRRGNGFGMGGKTGRGTAAAASADTETSALQQAQEAYNTAKQSTQLTAYEEELKAMVATGSLTQEQADLLLNAAKESQALSNGTCPSCGYQFQTTGTGMGRGGRNGMNGQNGMNGATTQPDANSSATRVAPNGAGTQSGTNGNGRGGRR